MEVRAELIVGADGRHSTVRERAGLAVEDLGAPMDVLWMRLSRRPDDPEQPLGRFDAGQIFVMLNRGDYCQCAFVIPKGGFDALKAKGIDAFRDRDRGGRSLPRGSRRRVDPWDDVKLLTVTVDRLSSGGGPVFCA